MADGTVAANRNQRMAVGGKRDLGGFVSQLSAPHPCNRSLRQRIAVKVDARLFFAPAATRNENCQPEAQQQPCRLRVHDVRLADRAGGLSWYTRPPVAARKYQLSDFSKRGGPFQPRSCIYFWEDDLESS